MRICQLFWIMFSGQWKFIFVNNDHDFEKWSQLWKHIFSVDQTAMNTYGLLKC